MTINQTDILTTLSYLRGERTVPNSVNDRKDFIQRTLDEVYKRYPWKFNELSATVTVVSGLATLPSGISYDHEFAISHTANGEEQEMAEINRTDRYAAEQGENKYWVTSAGDDTYVFNTKESVASIIVDYHAAAPQINASIATPYPNRLTIALGANRWVKAAQDPDADISQDNVLFENELAKDIAGQSRTKARPARRTAQSINDYSTGDF